jgi:hypothetical protein
MEWAIQNGENEGKGGQLRYYSGAYLALCFAGVHLERFVFGKGLTFLFTVLETTHNNLFDAWYSLTEN